MATVKVSEKTYKKLNQVAGKLRSRLGRPVSVDETLDYVMKENKMSPSEFAGSWSMTDKEALEVTSDLNRSWKRWKSRKD